MKKYIKILSIVLLVLVICGCSLLKESEKTYTANGISITMKKGFYEKDYVSLTTYFESEDAIFTALKESFTDLEEAGLSANSTLNEYIQAVKEGNQLDTEIIEDDGLLYMTYEKEISNKDFFYLATVYKTDDAFWLINFACESKNKNTLKPQFLKWAKTGEFK